MFNDTDTSEGCAAVAGPKNLELKSRAYHVTIRCFACFLLILGYVSLSSCTEKQEVALGWQSIFDGESLEGWIPKIAGEKFGEDRSETFRAENGVLSVNYDQYESFDQKFGHLFYKHNLSSYRLRLEYRFVGNQISGGPDWARLNSGLMLHAQKPETMDLDQNFPVSVEAQFLAAFDEMPERTTANICTPGTHIVISGDLVTEHCVDSNTIAPRAGEWVKFEVDVRANKSIKLYINGGLAFDFSEPQLDPEDSDAKKILYSEQALKSGYIALQSESHPIEFRNIQILDRSSAVEPDGVR